MIKKLFTRRTCIPHDSVQRRGALTGLAMIFMWAFMGFFQRDFSCYEPLLLTVLAAVAIHDMGFEFVVLPIALVMIHTMILVYCYTSITSAEHYIFRGIGLVWGLLSFVFPFLYMFIWTNILDVKPVESKTPNTNT